MTELHTIALTVRQPAGDLYHWALLECVDSRQGFKPIVMSSIGFPSYLQALEAGVEVIRCMSDAAPSQTAMARMLHATAHARALALANAAIRRAAA